MTGRDQAGYVVHHLIAPVAWLTPAQKLVHAYALRYRVNDDRREKDGLEPGQVWLRVRQRREDRPGVDSALGLNAETVTSAIRRLIEVGLLSVVRVPDQAERKAGRTTVYAVHDVAQALHSLENPDRAHSPENRDRDSLENPDRDSLGFPDIGSRDGVEEMGTAAARAQAREQAVAAADPVQVILDEVNTRAGDTRYTRAGWALQIQAVLDAHPELTPQDHLRVIDHHARHPWWVGPIRPSHLYSSVQQFERCLADAQASRPTRRGRGDTRPDGMMEWEANALAAFRNTGEAGFLQDVFSTGTPAAKAAAEHLMQGRAARTGGDA